MGNTLLAAGSISLIPDFLAESCELYESLVGSVAWDTRIRARQAASFGQPYNYSGIEWPFSPFPQVLVPLLNRVSESLGYIPNNCLANYYPSGESTMGFHSDSAEGLEPGTGIAIVSLGAERTITFRRIDDKSATESYRLPSGSLLWMSLEMQTQWKHAVLVDTAVNGGRISLTFRRMK
jgi:alkylated DNA repair dioxygenase AlkB